MLTLTYIESVTLVQFIGGKSIRLGTKCRERASKHTFLDPGMSVVESSLLRGIAHLSTWLFTAYVPLTETFYRDFYMRAVLITRFKRNVFGCLQVGGQV